MSRSLQPTRSEGQRIASVYAEYVSSDYRSRWTEHNAGNIAIVQERNVTEIKLLCQHRRFPDAHTKVLDFGCASGAGLDWLCKLGASSDNCYGVDVRPEAVAAARQRFNHLNFLCAGDGPLPFADSFFGLIQVHVVLSSILDAQLRTRLCGELDRILRPSGAIVIYDLRLSNPGNPNVGAVTRRHIRKDFPNYQFDFRSLTVVPPLVRKLGQYCETFYPYLKCLRLLHTHNMGLGIKPLTHQVQQRPAS